MKEFKCECQHSDERCPVCCEHGDVCQDERVCLDCGDDRTEAMMSAAYDYVKGMRE